LEKLDGGIGNPSRAIPLPFVEKVEEARSTGLGVSIPCWKSAGDVFCDIPPALEPALKVPGVDPFLLPVLGFDAAM